MWVDHRVASGDRGLQAAAIEQVHVDRTRAKMADQVRVVGRSGRSGYLVPSCDQQGQRPPSDHARRPCDEDFHRQIRLALVEGRTRALQRSSGDRAAQPFDGRPADAPALSIMGSPPLRAVYILVVPWGAPLNSMILNAECPHPRHSNEWRSWVGASIG
jgi:hypothetical protein